MSERQSRRIRQLETKVEALEKKVAEDNYEQRDTAKIINLVVRASPQRERKLKHLISQWKLKHSSLG